MKPTTVAQQLVAGALAQVFAAGYRQLFSCLGPSLRELHCLLPAINQDLL